MLQQQLHFGIVFIKELTRSYFWWPGLDEQIENTPKSCSSFQKVHNVLQLAPLCPWDWPEEAWQCVHNDFCRPIREDVSSE